MYYKQHFLFTFNFFFFMLFLKFKHLSMMVGMPWVRFPLGFWFNVLWDSLINIVIREMCRVYSDLADGLWRWIRWLVPSGCARGRSWRSIRWRTRWRLPRWTRVPSRPTEKHRQNTPRDSSAPAHLMKNTTHSTVHSFKTMHQNVNS